MKVSLNFYVKFKRTYVRFNFPIIFSTDNSIAYSDFLLFEKFKNIQSGQYIRYTRKISIPYRLLLFRFIQIPSPLTFPSSLKNLIEEVSNFLFFSFEYSKFPLFKKYRKLSHETKTATNFSSLQIFRINFPREKVTNISTELYLKLFFP